MTNALSRETFRARYGPWALVAGASEGMGAAWAREVAARGCDVVLVARRGALLQALAAEIQATHGVATRPLVADLAELGVVALLRATTDALDVGLVVYNAADPAPGRFVEQPVDGLMRALDLNCRGLVLLAHHYGARLLARGRGGLIAMSSLSGLGGAAALATYAASKGFGWLFAESLWKEWGPRGVDVLAGVAGLTNTPHSAASGVDMSRMPAMDATDVVRELLDALGREPCWVAGEANRQGLAALESLSRRQRIEGLSASTALLYGFGEP